MDAWEPDAKPSSSVGGRDGGCDGVLCGPGSLSDEEDEDLDEDGDDELWVARSGGRSPSGSSRGRVAGRAMIGGRLSVDCEDCPGVSGGVDCRLACGWQFVLQ